VQPPEAVVVGDISMQTLKEKVARIDKEIFYLVAAAVAAETC